MRDNETKPTSAEISAWKRDTDGNHHKNVRIKIGKWASKHSQNADVKPVYEYLTNKIGNLYDRAIVDHGFEREDFDAACMLTNVLISTIEQEYGKETAGMISVCL